MTIPPEDDHSWPAEFYKVISERIDLLERTINAMEQQIATLTVAFGEQAVIAEALVGQLVYANDEERAAFTQRVEASRREMLGIMKEVADVLESDDAEPTGTMEDLA